MNAQISIIIKSFEIKNSQKKETGQNCNEKNRAVEAGLAKLTWSETSDLMGASVENLGTSGSPVSLRSAQGPQGTKASDLMGAPIAAVGKRPFFNAPSADGSAERPARSAERRSKNSSAVCKIKAPQTEQTILFLLRKHLRSIRLPKTRTLYTVLRSPHIDKKSREQFEMKIHKQCFFIQSETKYLRTQLLLLKLQDIPGVQCKIVVNYKTRLGLLSR